MGNTPKFRFQSGILFFLVWYICTQATYTRTILTVLVKICTIDVDLHVKCTLESFFWIFNNRTSYIHIFTVCRNYIIVLYIYLNFRACSIGTCNLNLNWSVRSQDHFFFAKGHFVHFTGEAIPFQAEFVVKWRPLFRG